MRYFRWKLDLVSNILWAIVAQPCWKGPWCKHTIAMRWGSPDTHSCVQRKREGGGGRNLRTSYSTLKSKDKCQLRAILIILSVSFHQPTKRKPCRTKICHVWSSKFILKSTEISALKAGKSKNYIFRAIWLICGFFN